MARITRLRRRTVKRRVGADPPRGQESASSLSRQNPSRWHAFSTGHLRVLLSSLGRIYRSPVSAIMTIGVIGISLALPTGLYVVLDNIKTVSSRWGGGTQISLFTKISTQNSEVEQLAERLREREEISNITIISREQALQEFRQLSGFGQALDILESNPLPTLLLIEPSKSNSGPAEVELLIEQLQQLPEADLVQLDMQWLKRLYALMEIGRRAIVVIGILLSMAVLLIVGNTIRLDIQNRRDEIIVTKLVGATNAFIRRPFLYTGLWYGFCGGLLAWCLVNLSLYLLSGPVQNLAVLYSSDFTLNTLSFSNSLLLLSLAIALGLSGSWFAVGRHLREVEPS